MKKINLKKPLRQLSGDPCVENGKEIILSTSIAEIIMSSPGSDALKFQGLCEDLYKTGFLTADDADLELFRSEVEKNQYITRLLKGQVQREIVRQMAVPEE